MQSPCLHAPRGHPFPGSTFLHAGSVIVGFRAAQSEPPESPSPWRGAAGSNRGDHLAGGGGGGESARPHSLLSDLLRDVQRAAAEADALMADALAYEVDDEDEDGEDDLDDDELDLLEALDAAWGSPSSSVFSAATGASRASTASSSRPIAIPAASYFKDQTQRAYLEKLNKKRQWYSQQQEQDRLVGKTGAKAAPQQVPKPPLKQHKQYNGHGGQQQK